MIVEINDNKYNVNGINKTKPKKINPSNIFFLTKKTIERIKNTNITKIATKIIKATIIIFC